MLSILKSIFNYIHLERQTSIFTRVSNQKMVEDLNRHFSKEEASEKIHNITNY